MLVVALVMLLVLTILGVAGMENSTMQERIAGNLKEQHRAFSAAEKGLRAGEQHARPAPVDPCTTTAPCGTATQLDANPDNADEARPQYIFTVSGPQALREVLNADGTPVTGARGGARRLYNARYTVDATGSVAEAGTTLQSTAAVPLY